MGTKVEAVDAEAVDGTWRVESIWPVNRLDDLCERSDMVVIGTACTANLDNAGDLVRMRSDPNLNVVSRGGVVVEDALVTTLRSGKLAGAVRNVTMLDPPGKARFGTVASCSSSRVMPVPPLARSAAWSGSSGTKSAASRTSSHSSTS